MFLARAARAVLLPRSAFCFVEPPDDHAKLCTVSTTRVLLWWALLMTFVISALVQPFQPVVVVPSLFFFSRLPFAAAPTPK